MSALSISVLDSITRQHRIRRSSLMTPIHVIKDAHTGTRRRVVRDGDNPRVRVPRSSSSNSISTAAPTLGLGRGWVVRSLPRSYGV